MLASYQLAVPNTSASPALVHAFVLRLAQSAGMPDADARAISEATRQAAEYVVQFSYPENRDDELHCFCDVLSDRIVVRLNDHGMPAIPLEQAPEEADAQAAVEPLRAALALVDEYRWVLKGYEGKELTLQQQLDRAPLPEVIARNAALKRPTRAQPVDADAYVIRRFRPDDAPAIAELVYRNYGTTYDDEDYYYPEKIREENANGAMVSVVAAHPSGEVVGHYALERRHMAGIYEGSSAVVNPVHRGRRLMEKMRQVEMDIAREMGLRGVIFLPWTAHVYSQKANEHFHAALVGINLNDSAPVAIAGVESESMLHRVSTMLYFVPLQLRPRRTLYVPSHLHGWVSELLGPLGEIELADAHDARPSGRTVLRTQELPHDHFSEITVDHIGDDAVAEVDLEVRRLLAQQKMETIFLNLPMADPATLDLARHAEGMGFAFIGVGPDYCDGSDSLRLALLDALPDPALIQVYSEVGQRLRAFAIAEQSRVNAKDPIR